MVEKVLKIRQSGLVEGNKEDSVTFGPFRCPLNIFSFAPFGLGKGFHSLNWVSDFLGAIGEMAWLTRFVVMVSFLALGILISPDAFGSKFGGQIENSAKIGGSLAVVLKLAHLLSFATAWGAALWVTFIGGIIMFKHLPRHMFGNLQGKMFPAYFSMVAVCGAICLAAFSLMHPWTSASSTEKLQVGLLSSSLVFTLTNLLVFTPITMNMMKVRHKVEREENIGDEVGMTKNREVAKRNPKLAEVNKKFGMLHGLSSLANLLSFGGLAMHSWYLASHLLL